MKKPLILLLAIVLAVPLIPFIAIGELPGMEWIEGNHTILTFLYGAGLLSADIVLPLPSSIIAVFLGAKLGLVLGTLSNFLGLMLGSLIGYGLGWYIGRPVLDKMVSHQHQEIYAKMENQLSYWALGITRSIPILAEASVLAAGVAGLNIRKTLPMLFAANLGLAILYSAFGYFGTQQSSPLLLFAGGIIVPACGILIIFILFGKSFFRRTSPDQI